jgi:hypothetical protein
MPTKRDNRRNIVESQEGVGSHSTLSSRPTGLRGVPKVTETPACTNPPISRVINVSGGQLMPVMRRCRGALFKAEYWKVAQILFLFFAFCF